MKKGSTECQGALRYRQIHNVCGLSSVSNSVTQDKEPEVLVTHSRVCRLTAKGYLQTDMAWPGHLATELGAKGPPTSMPRAQNSPSHVL